MSSDYVLEVRNLQKHYGRHEVLKNVSFSVKRGEIVGLLGKNGAGKTTLMKSILGLLQYSGKVLLNGELLSPKDAVSMNKIGVLVDTSFFEDMTAYDNLKILMLSTPNRDNSHIGQDIVELLSFVGLEENAKDRVKGFSFGMKQRLALAGALMNDPSLLILDEPFVGLDPLGISLVKERLNGLVSEGKTSVIFSSHQLAEVAEISEELIVIDEGTVRYRGSYSELSSRNKEYRFVLDKPISPALLHRLGELGCALSENRGCEFTLSHGETSLDTTLRFLLENGFSIVEILREDKPLSALFT